MIDKIVPTLADAVAGVANGATVLVSGFGEVGAPLELVEALLDQGATDLTIVANNAGVGDRGIGALLREGRVRRVVCSYPRSTGSVWFERRYAEGEVELTLVPQGTLTERIRAAGAGIGGFFTRTAAETQLAAGREVRVIGGVPHVFEEPIRGDVALVKAHAADRWGNLVYRASARNYGPTVATAADVTVVQASTIVELGALDPETVMTPGIFVDRVVEVPGA